MDHAMKYIRLISNRTAGLEVFNLLVKYQNKTII